VIFSSPEYFSDIVQGQYQAALGRNADAGGLSSFVAGLQQGVSDQTVLAMILGSQESAHNRTRA
jgi:hypothetical protein